MKCLTIFIINFSSIHLWIFKKKTKLIKENDENEEVIEWNYTTCVHKILQQKNR